MRAAQRPNHAEKRIGAVQSNSSPDSITTEGLPNPSMYITTRTHLRPGRPDNRTHMRTDDRHACGLTFLVAALLAYAHWVSSQQIRYHLLVDLCIGMHVWVPMYKSRLAIIYRWQSMVRDVRRRMQGLTT